MEWRTEKSWFDSQPAQEHTQTTIQGVIWGTAIQECQDISGAISICLHGMHIDKFTLLFAITQMTDKLINKQKLQCMNYI